MSSAFSRPVFDVVRTSVPRAHILAFAIKISVLLAFAFAFYGALFFFPL
jgi:hypothetical protein